MKKLNSQITDYFYNIITIKFSKMDSDCIFSTILQTDAKHTTHFLMTSKIINSLDTEYLWKLLVERYGITFSVEFNDLKMNNKYKLYHLLVTFLMQLAGSNMEKFNVLVTFIKKYINDTFNKNIILLSGDGYSEKLLLLDFLYRLNSNIVVKIQPFYATDERLTLDGRYDNKKYIIIEDVNYEIENITDYLIRMTYGRLIYYRQLGAHASDSQNCYN